MDEGIFDNFLDTNTLESNLINVKLEPGSPPQSFFVDSLIGGGSNNNSNMNSSSTFINNNYNSSISNNSIIGVNSNSSNSNHYHSIHLPNQQLQQHLQQHQHQQHQNQNQQQLLQQNYSKSTLPNSTFLSSLPSTVSDASATESSIQHLLTSQSPFTQQFHYYPTSSPTQHSSTNTSVSTSPLQTSPSINMNGNDSTTCDNSSLPISSNSIMINSVHHQLINHLHQAPTQNIFFPSSSSSSSNNNNNNNNNFQNNNNNTLRHQQNITRSIYLNPTLDQTNLIPQPQQQQQQLNNNNNNIITTNTNLTTPIFNELVQNEEESKLLIQQQILNINSTTPELNSQMSPTTTTTSTITSQPLVIIGDLDIIIEQQPPSDVRTRTPNDRRTFNTVIRVVGDLQKNSVGGVLVQLAYANTSTADRPSQFILGGNKIGIIGKDGKVAFDSLSMTEASTKHRENEFCLEYVLISDDNRIYTSNSGIPFIKRSRAFYAYSNQKVLSRRRNVTLRTLSSNRGTSLGGDQMHVVGSPFIRCNSLRCIFHTPHGDIPATNIELYSESVLFFTLPPYPTPPNFSAPEGTELPVQVVITNDGRNYSNPLAFTYIYEGDNHGNKRLRSRF
ncbi:hypothetical protein DLAC_06033 [Tieghemostelium lacteum]|uniref:Uncharacterized protein n=1 Tax=Tieghemostelium lacteum TaxID=361077 RepID=A0A151ZHG7_TIELA|nr:hypothetical protein DLAC_06033 [Tieghemostelium lacteum]|eukprot:KYQ93359.1 hypothetical protein DLAC_06033 [Tieghemostelium lacteum]